MPVKSAASGPRFDVQYAIDAQGRQPAETFLAELQVDRRAEYIGLLALFQRYADFGVLHNREQFKQLAGTDPTLVEFKKGQARVLGFYNGPGVLVLTHGLIKKRDRLDPADIDRAHRIRAEHIARAR